MRDSSRSPTVPSSGWWVTLWRWLWRGFCLLWGVIVVGVIVNMASTRLTSDQGFPPDSPVGLALHNLPLTIAASIILLLLTLLVGMLYRQSNAHSSQADSSLPLPAQQNRLVLVRALRQEYTRRLNHSLQGAAMMALELHERTNVTLSSAQLVFHRTAVTGEYPLPPGTSIVEAYDEAGQGLLILGDPGAGKTTLLLDLGRELLARAESDPTAPIPVILNLSSWAVSKSPLNIWLIDQLQLAYGVPRRLGQAWLEHDQWLLLLDGLDEVAASARSACIEAINTYRSGHFTSLVVCSRSRTYLGQATQLVLPAAVVVQPLTQEQVTMYLKQVGKPMAAVRAALRSNAALRQMVTTPLMLNMVILTYRGKTLNNLPHRGTVEEQQHQIFASYVDRMLERPIPDGKFTPQQLRLWLSRLARQMQQHQLTEFYLENLQPSWLATKQAQLLYFWMMSLIFGLFTGLFFGLFTGLFFGLFTGLFFGLFTGLARPLKTPLVKNLASLKSLWQGLRSAL